MSPAEQPTQHQIQGCDVTLSVLEFGPQTAPAVVMVHGLRDSAYSLLPVATQLAQPQHTKKVYRVLIMELRGHGGSGKSDAYAMPNFLLDLHAVIQQFAPTGCALFGHSLGGHITSKFAGLFPELVKTLIVVEGLGPPRRPHEGVEAAEIQAYRHSLLTRLAKSERRGRPITSIEDVVARLQRNNPRLQRSHAEQFAPYLVKTADDGTLQWAFDSRANSVFIGTSTNDNARFWRQVKAPTCVISGVLSYEYWGREMPAENFSGRFAEGEIEARAATFANHEHHWFDQSGHMVHYDEPRRLGELSRRFLEQNYV